MSLLLDALKELQQLRYCAEELNRRVEMQLSDAWYWQIKQKVARYCIGMKERQMELPPDEPAGELTLDEQAKTRRTHPLLTRPPETEAPPYRIVDKQWLSRLRSKVLSYISALQERQG